MGSDRPKVLHELAGQPLLGHVLGAVFAAGARGIVVVVSSAGNEVEKWVRDAYPSEVGAGIVRFAYQQQPRGTGDAVRCASSILDHLAQPNSSIVILNGDVPLVRAESLVALVAACQRASAEMAFATFIPPDPTGYGRVVRNDDGDVVAIREHRNATDDELAIRECNVGLYCVRRAVVAREIPYLQPQPPKHEIYLTDLVERVVGHGRVATIDVDPLEAAGINTVEQLEQLERHLSQPRRQ